MAPIYLCWNAERRTAVRVGESEKRSKCFFENIIVFFKKDVHVFGKIVSCFSQESAGRLICVRNPPESLPTRPFPI